MIYNRVITDHIPLVSVGCNMAAVNSTDLYFIRTVAQLHGSCNSHSECDDLIFYSSRYRYYIHDEINLDNQQIYVDIFKLSRHINFWTNAAILLATSSVMEKIKEIIGGGLNDVMKCKTFLALLALCAGNSTVTTEFPPQRPVTRSFDAFLALHQNKRMSKQSRRRWFETPSRILWRHCNVMAQGQITLICLYVSPGLSWRLVFQKQVSRGGTRNWIPHYC